MEKRQNATEVEVLPEGRTIDEAIPVSLIVKRTSKDARCRFVNSDERHRLDRRRQFVGPPSQKVAEALRTPKAVWSLITSPGSSFRDRLDAASLAVMPGEPWLERIDAARRELAAEARLHDWGFKNVSCSNTILSYSGNQERRDFWRDLDGDTRSREILGHEWHLEGEGQLYNPFTLEELAASPWPKQVQHALEILWRTLSRGRRSDLGRWTSIATTDEVLHGRGRFCGAYSRRPCLRESGSAARQRRGCVSGG